MTNNIRSNITVIMLKCSSSETVFQAQMQMSVKANGFLTLLCAHTRTLM